MDLLDAQLNQAAYTAYLTNISDVFDIVACNLYFKILHFIN